MTACPLVWKFVIPDLSEGGSHNCTIFAITTFALRILGYRYRTRMQNRSLTKDDLKPVDRRQFVRMLGLGGAAMFLAPTVGQFSSWLNAPAPVNPANSANTPHPIGQTIDDLPAEWVRVLGQPLRGYAAFLGGLQLRRISLHQLIEPHVKMRGKVRSGIPPASLWKNMRPTLLVADQIAHRLGENVQTIVSAYRSPAYNALCPGAASGSQHMRNVALDLQFNSSPSKVAKVAREVRAEGKFLGGIGLYPGFTHVDTRGTNADWRC
jgi:hypothetical protein